MTISELHEISNKEPILVLTSTVWCSPCRSLKSTLSEISGIKIVEIDVDDSNNSEIVEFYKIRSIPTLLFVERGELADKAIGSISKTDVLNRLETAWPNVLVNA